MKPSDKEIIVALVVLTIGYFAFAYRPATADSSDAAASVVPADAPDMLAVFSQNPDRAAARADAYHVAAVAEVQARVIHAQASEPSDKRLLGKAGDIEDLRMRTLYVLRGSETFSRTYGDQWKATVGTFFDKRVGDNAGALDAKQWEAWEQACLDFSAACKAAGDRL